MLRSMTGFGRGEYKHRAGKISAEMRTTNHRFYELSARMPNYLLFLEDKIRAHINTKIKRGRVNLSLVAEGGLRPQRSLEINKALAGKYYKDLSGLKKKLRINEHISLGELALLPEVIGYRSLDIDTEKIWPHIKAALDKAAVKLIRAREYEGAILQKDLLARIRIIERLISQIQRQVPVVVARYSEKLRERISHIAKSVKLDAARLETEVAIFAKNCDITEELIRALAHIKNFRGRVLKGGETGRQLDFICQELFRETNTTGAKAQDVKISRLVIQIKEQIEKIREQVQNIE